MLFAGFNVSQGDVPAVGGRRSSARSANLVGSWIAYAIGYYGRVELLEKHGDKLHIKPSHLEWADRWFERYGDAAVFFAPHAADHPDLHLAARRRRADAVLALHRAHARSAACPWVFVLTFIGKQVGDNWEDWKDSLHYVDYAVAALIVVGIVYLVVRWRRGRRRRAADARA